MIIEGIGTKFNGSLKLDGRWVNIRKGTKYEHVKVGDDVEVVMKTWEMNGKSGTSISEILVKSKPAAAAIKDREQIPVAAPVEELAPAVPAPSRGRDFDKEARGKTRCQMYSAALQSPVLQQFFYTKEASLADILEVVQKVADAGVSYTFGE